MTTEAPTVTAAIVLWGLEASARQRMRDMAAKGRCPQRTAAHVELKKGSTDFNGQERFVVSYDATGKFSYFYRERPFQMLSVVENRAVFLMALESRLGEGVAS
jgi:hypothetical protein